MDDSGGFLSNYTSRLDAKGRVSIPAPFRAVLGRDGFEDLYVHPSLDVEAVDCGGHALLREIHELLRPLSPYSEERDLFSTALIGTSEILKIDTEGRVILSESAKTYAGIATEVTFVGHGFKFQIRTGNIIDAGRMPAPPGVKLRIFSIACCKSGNAPLDQCNHGCF